jgi:hypothetical protein
MSEIKAGVRNMVNYGISGEITVDAIPKLQTCVIYPQHLLKIYVVIINFF